MVDLVSSLFLAAFALTIAATWSVFAILPKGAGNERLRGHGGIMLGRGLMEVVYRMFEPLVALMVRAHITPNMVTAFSLVPAFASAVLFAFGHFGLGAILAMGSGICDMLDGMLARRYQSESDVGELFDAAVDRYVEYFLLAGLLLYLRHIPVAQVMCLAAILGSFMVSYTTAKAEALGIEPPKGAMRRAERAVYIILGCGSAPLWHLVVPGSPVAYGIALGRELPVELAVTIIGVVANVSAIRRMLRIAESIRAKKLAA